MGAISGTIDMVVVADNVAFAPAERFGIGSVKKRRAIEITDRLRNVLFQCLVS